MPTFEQAFAVSIKILKLILSNIFVWFAQLDLAFEFHNITKNATKFYYVASTLLTKYAIEVRNLLCNVPH